MAFTNNRPEFRQGQSYTEELHAKALNEGIPSFVQQGLELAGTTLTAGVAINAGVPGQWGNLGETHTITANYTGYVILKTVLDGANGLNSVELSTTRNDTDPRSTEKTRYFTIYELNNGVIVQDFRHINYVKSFYLKNMGGNNIAWVLNGFTSDPFDASVLAGNRVLLNDYDINYDDSIHGASALRDILLDIFLKAQTLVGNDKNFEVDFFTNNIGRNVNLSESLNTFIENTHGFIPTPSGWGWTFRMSATTNDQGFTDENAGDVIKITLDNRVKTFTFNFEYDVFSAIAIPMDEQGNTKALSKNIITAIGFNSEGAIYFNKLLSPGDLLHYSIWNNDDFYIAGLNGNPTTGTGGMTRFKGDNTVEYTIQSAPYITAYMTELGTTTGTFYEGANGQLCGSAMFSADSTPIGGGPSITVGLNSAIRITSQTFATTSSIQLHNSSVNQLANITFNLTSNDNNKMMSIVPFSLFQLLKHNDDSEIANIIYNNQFVSEAQKQEFEENGVTPLFHALGEL